MKLTFETPADNLHPFTLNHLGAPFDPLVEAAKRELGQKVRELSDGESATWGFFPELSPTPSDYPACIALKRYFDKNFLSLPEIQNFDLKLAFIRLAIGEPISSFGGLHIDASAGIDHLPPRNRQPGQDGILRTLINLYHEPRTLQYCAESIATLRRCGISVP